MLGIAIASSSISVGSRCVFVAAGIGAVATQNQTDPRLGELGLDLLRRGYSAEATIAELVRAGTHSDHRQLACVDHDGGSAAWTGEAALEVHASRTARDLAVAGNLLTNAGVVDAMADSFLAHPEEDLPERLIQALIAGQAAGGEVGRNERSACLKVADRESFAFVDLRVDWDEEGPVTALQSLWGRFAPQARLFEARARYPSAETLEAH